MSRRLAGIACMLLLAGCSGAEQPVAPASVASPAIKPVPVAAADTDTLARYDGYGDMRFGMDEATFDKSWSGELKGAPG